LKDVTKENNENRKQLLDNQLDAKHQLRLTLVKIDLKNTRCLCRQQEKKRKHDNIHQDCLTGIAARKASSKSVKETAARHKIRIKEKELETSTQRVQTMLETYQDTNSGQFPNGRTNLENVSRHTANCLPAKYCGLTLLFFYDG
jgi:hypothetical protein